MNCSRDKLLLYAVTDRSWLKGESLAAQVEKAILGGATIIQLREKQLDPRDFLAEARTIQEICHAHHVPLIINDSVEIAAASQADGVHLGQGDRDPREARSALGPKAIIGVSAHNPQEARAALAAGADYLGAGAVFPTGTKQDVTALKPETLREICQVVPIPVVAIGGINRQNAPQLSGLGVAGLAVVSAIFAQPDIRAAAAAMRDLALQVRDGR